MDAIEKRARKLLDTELRKLGLHEDAYHVGCGADLDRNDQAAINAIAAALTPPEGFVLVPVDLEQGLRMWQAGIKARNTGGTVEAIYAAMIAARPEVTP
ncbi:MULTISPECIES: hypothetical protein [Stenotrophomonas]|uniref:hypothetical protein n=1 Tax=Stenotrophomonas TaxID=40323 RepID=UPI000DB34820|nr:MULTISPECIES: hypothetical protein [Stenotrophomonas]MBA0428411.1 hypothetical protein [Stenotrophomonas maltophilia]MDH0276122.1 hypothetical protein [Stenotrophomonas sp. GD04089]MDH1911017.1 hypothetical protein [Stenotrophomonas sp. GD03794]PZP76110.1 MAG: hypothetical protein DI592_19210 [Stenotrophomonas maltophilia]